MFHVEHSRLLPPRKCLTPASREAPPGLEGQQARVPEFHVEPVDWMFHVEHSPLGRGRGAIDGLDHTRLRGRRRMRCDDSAELTGRFVACLCTQSMPLVRRHDPQARFT